MRFEAPQPSQDAILEALDTQQAEDAAAQPQHSKLDVNRDGKVDAADGMLAVLRLFDLDDDGDIDLWDLVSLPPALLRVLQLFFGVVWTALPLTSILGAVTAIAATAHLWGNALAILDALDGKFESLVNDVREHTKHFETALLVTIAVDLSIVAHGLLVGAYSTQNFLCGPRGRITLCRAAGDSKATRTERSCLASSLHCVFRVLRFLLHLVAAVGRGVFGVIACLALWLSMSLILGVIFSCGFSVIVMLAVEYGCQALSDTEGLAQHLGNTTAHILQQRLDETGMMGYLNMVQMAEQQTLSTSQGWMPGPLQVFMPADLGLGRALKSEVTELLAVAKAQAASTVESQSRQYLELVQTFCSPLLATIPLWRQALVAGLVMLVAQIVMLIAHQTCYTIWFYEVKLVQRELDAAGWQRRAERSEDYRRAVQRAGANKVAASPAAPEGGKVFIDGPQRMTEDR